MQKKTTELTLKSLHDLFEAVEEQKAELRKLRREFVERKPSEAANVSISAVVETPDELEKMLETLGKFSCKPPTVSVETRDPVRPFIVDADTFEVSLRGASIKVDGVPPVPGCPRPPAGHNLQEGESAPAEAPDAACIVEGPGQYIASFALCPPPPPPPVDAFTTMTYGTAPNLVTVTGNETGRSLLIAFAHRQGGMLVARRALDRQEVINLYRHIGQWLKDTGDEALHPGEQ